MSEATFDKLEELTPTGRSDVPVVALGEVLQGLADPSDETLTGINILKQFEQASAFLPPKIDGIYLWLGYCVGGFHEVPRREEFFVFAVSRHGEQLAGFATALQDDDPSLLPALLIKKDVELVTKEQIKNILVMLESEPPNPKRSDWFSPLEHTDGDSLRVSPAISASYYLRQCEDKLVFVQPSRCGGWYGELWPLAV